MIYSPSQTDLYAVCPMKRQLRYRDRWVTKVAGKRDLAAILGQAFAVGVAQHNTMRAGGNINGVVPASVARTYAEGHLWSEIEDAGRRVEPWDRSQYEAVPERAFKLVEKYIAHDPIPSGWPILGIEERLPSGVARPDLVVDDGRGPTPLDYKTKLSLKRDYEEREVSRWRMSWQLLHYCWELKADHYYICLIVAEPFRVQLYPFEVHPKMMQWWVESAEQRWGLMAMEDADERVVGMASQHADAFGECEYATACFQHHLDPERMKADYVQRGR